MIEVERSHVVQSDLLDWVAICCGKSSSVTNYSCDELLFQSDLLDWAAICCGKSSVP